MLFLPSAQDPTALIRPSVQFNARSETFAALDDSGIRNDERDAWTFFKNTSHFYRIHRRCSDESNDYVD